jgi:protein MpaA
MSDLTPHSDDEGGISPRTTIVVIALAAIAIVVVAGWLLIGGSGVRATSSQVAPVETTQTPQRVANVATSAPATPGVAGSAVASASPAAPPAPQPAASVGPTTIGSSVKGTPIEAYRFGSGSKRYLVVGGIHGNEYGAAVGEAFVAKLEADPALVPSDTEIDVIPSINPDGRAADTRGNADHVDLNRNFPSRNWTSKIPPSDDPATRGLTGGTSPGSEPETKALLGYFKNGYAGMVTLHSRGGIVDYDGPGGLAIARRVSARIGLPISHLSYQPSVHGSMGLYVPERYGVPVITLELTSPKLSSRVLNGILAIVK